MKDEEIARCANFRSRHRFPALSYFHKANSTSVWRCSQNLTGVFGRRDEWDEKMLLCIGLTNPNTDQVAIVDARSKTRAQLNRVKGGGHEQEDYYINCKLYFGGIDNIHGVRDAYQKCYPAWEGKLYNMRYKLTLYFRSMVLKG